MPSTVRPGAEKDALKKLTDSFEANPLAWLLFGALLIAIYVSYHDSQKAGRVCDLTSEVREIYVPPAIDKTADPKQLAEAIRALETSGTVEGRLSLWQQTNGEKIAYLCGEESPMLDGESPH